MSTLVGAQFGGERIGIRIEKCCVITSLPNARGSRDVLTLSTECKTEMTLRYFIRSNTSYAYLNAAESSSITEPPQCGLLNAGTSCPFEIVYV